MAAARATATPPHGAVLAHQGAPRAAPTAASDGPMSDDETRLYATPGLPDPTPQEVWNAIKQLNEGFTVAEVRERIAADREAHRDRLTDRERKLMIEMNEACDILAEALGYTHDEQYGWVVGDHTIVTLAMEVRTRGVKDG
ncbi:hypothetical protein GCM10029976_090380 [Kribbella albertanoniae]|uniref:Uncharacterized protein n=1 Tax=Kribbella albertanoniae TaxID=1266829 RepID=A0A4R4PK95_9ACTN|nr:hypothetical protein [Kribbella albertanoniae]TDC22487.1 hypothetical protein E1261_30725 [Kribbella albertanoniae]